MTSRRAKFDFDTFYAFLNSKDDLTAIVHGVSCLDALMRDGLDMLLTERGLKPIALDRLGVTEKAASLIAADRLDAETYAVIVHFVAIRNRFAHNLQASITAKEGRDAWDLLPDRAKSRKKHRAITRDAPPATVARWCLSMIVIRVSNRAINLHNADLRYG